MPNPTSKLNLVVNGVTTQLDIHDANAVDLTSNQTVGGNKEFTGTTTAHDLVPSATDTYNLGSSSYQWNNAYIKSLTINGVACGDILTHNVSEFAYDTDVVHKSGDETVAGNKTWSGLNTFQQNITYERINFYHQSDNPCYILKDTGLEKGGLVSTNRAAYPGLWFDKNSNALGYVRFVKYSSGRQTAEFRVSNLLKNGTVDPTGSEVNCTVNLELQPSGEKSLIPEWNNDINLGTSTNKWKTLNGINPGALSLPDYTQSVTLSFAINSPLEVPFNGFIRIQLNVSNYSYLVIYVNNQVAHIGQSALKSTLTAFIPVSQNDVVKINVTDGEYAGYGNIVLFKNKGNS